MVTSASDASATRPRTDSAGAIRGAVSDAGSGWLVLRGCALGGGGPRAGLVLLHPRIGVALVDFAPNDTDAAGRLRRALDARCFPAIFGGYPPVAQAVLPADRLHDLDRVLLAEFERQPPLALAGGDAWIGTARAAIEAEAPAAVAELPARKRRRASPWLMAAMAAMTGAAVGALVGVSVVPERGTESAARDVGTGAAQSTVASLSKRAEDAAGARSAGPRPGPEAAPAAEDAAEQDVLAALRSAEPAPGAGAVSAAAPQEAESATTANAAGVESRPEPPAPVAVSASGFVRQPQDQDATPAAKPEEEPDAAAAQPRPPPGDATVAVAPQEPEPAPTAMAMAGRNRAEAPPRPPMPPDAVGGPPHQPWHALPAAAPPEAPSSAAAVIQPPPTRDGARGPAIAARDPGVRDGRPPGSGARHRGERRWALPGDPHADHQRRNAVR